MDEQNKHNELEKLRRDNKLLRSALKQYEHLQKLYEQANIMLKEKEAEVRKQKEKAEEATRAKSLFLANMSHEIRTPMNGVLGMAEIMKDTTLNDDQREYLGVIETSANNLLSIINDILDFSKIEAGKIELEKAPVRIETVVNEVSDILATKAAKKHIELITFVNPDIPDLVEADHVRLRQILLNLANNSVKFTDEGHVLLSCELIKKEDRCVFIHFKVEDTGIGISEENQKKLFKSFSQTETSTTRKYGGTGLGLTISKQLVELMGGNIKVKSGPGEGSTFSFEISLPIISEKAFYTDKIKNLRITAVDDNSTNRLVLRKYLEAFDSEAKIFHSVKGFFNDFVKKTEAGEPYDVALIDFNMPHSNGLELAANINKKFPDHPSRIIILSSITDLISKEHTSKYGIDAQLNKPLKVSQLFNTIYLAMNPVEKKEDTENEKKDAFAEYQILLAEDNRINQRVALSLLSKLGQNADVVSNGKEAVEKFKEKYYDLVFMDVEMPLMDGITATKQIRKFEHENNRKEVCIVALTAGVMKEDKEKCLNAGMNDFIPKPFNIKHITDIFSKLCNE
ncbi:MAG TPA: response regulator [Bacteroidales bacterium]|nr:response regulator [Bacteroidales bacterium]